ATTGAATCGRAGRTVTRAYQQQFGHRVINDGIPYCGTAAGSPPLAVPRRGGHFQLLVFEPICGNCVLRLSYPAAIAVVHFVGSDEAAHTELGTVLPHEYFAFGHTRCTSDRIRLIRRRGLHGPDLFSSGGIQRNKPVVDGANKYFAFPHGDA